MPDVENIAGAERCPKCGYEMLDLRHVGFNPDALDHAGVCYQWSDSDFTCLTPKVVDSSESGG